MHIMEITSGTELNGAVGHCLTLSRELTRQGHEVTILCRPQSWIQEQLRQQSAVRCVESTLRRHPGELRRIATLAHQLQVDILHTHMSSAHFFGVLLRYLARIPSVATAHQRHIQLHWRLNDHVIGCCQASSNHQIRINRVSRRRIETIFNFVDLSKFQGGKPEHRADVRRKLKIADDAVLLGTVGDVTGRKGAIHLIHSLPELVRHNPNVHVLWVGRFADTDYARDVQDLSRRLQVDRHITWTGQRADIPDLLQAMDVYVLPSEEESFPLSILEAMAAGLPVIATSVGGIPECIDSQHNGTLVPPRDPRALADALAPLVQSSDLRRSWGARSQAMAQNSYSTTGQTAKTAALFQRVLERRRGKSAGGRMGPRSLSNCRPTMEAGLHRDST